MATKDLSIIIVSHNTKRLLRRCLNSVFTNLRASNIKFELIVVDNASRDGSVEVIENEFPQVRLIKNQKNLGFGIANNQGVKKSRGKYLLFLNSDIVVLNEAIPKLYRFAKKQEKYGIYGGKLFNPNGTIQPSCGYFYSLPIVFLSLFLKGDQLHLTRFSPDKIKKTDWVSGACLLISRDIFNELGGFDERIFMYMDEVDLCYRAKQRGYCVVFYPEAHFIHVGSASSQDKRAPYVNLFSGLMYFYQKHWPQKLWLLKIMLKMKALIAIFMGRILGNKSLVANYQKAMAILAQKADSKN